jgi:arylsulfatase A-like enzyme
MFFHFPLYLGGSESEAVLPAIIGEEKYWRAVPSTTMIKRSWKLIYYYEYENYELFNLEKDISESENLSALYPEKSKEMLKELKEWVEDVEAPAPSILNVKSINNK